MKSKKASLMEMGTVLFWCIFIGVVGISIGLGSLYPPLNSIAQPFVCPSGQMTYQKSVVDQAIPNQTFFSANWTCTQADASSKPVNPSFFAGLIYGLVCYPMGLFLKRREDTKAETERNASEFRPYNSQDRSGLP